MGGMIKTMHQVEWSTNNKSSRRGCEVEYLGV
jgi:hypothetical protein